jgi:ABC-type Fe3+ transport system permease subunit
MKKLSILLSSVFLLITNNANAITTVTKNNTNKWANTADAICTGFVILGISLVIVFGTKAILDTYKEKKNEV